MKKFLCMLLVMVVMVCAFSIPAAAASKKFTDVPEGIWYADAVYALVDRGIVSGVTDNTFCPEDTLTAEQLIKMVVLASGEDIEQGTGKEWAQPYINCALDNGLVLPGEFDDYRRQITRGEIARMLVRALKDVVYLNDLSSYSSALSDFDNIASELQKYILKAYAVGLITGYPDNTFQAGNCSTRAEAATMVHRLIDSRVRQSSRDPDNPDGYVTYVEPWDLIRKVAELEMLGNFEEAYKYLDKGFTGNGIFTVEKYKEREDFHVSKTFKFMSLQYPDEEFLIRCKIIDKKSENKIVVAYGIYDGNIVKKTGDDDPYDSRAKTLIKTDGLWYIDLSNRGILDAYFFKYSEGK